MNKRHWSIIGIAILSLLWLQAEADRWQLRNELKRAYLGDVTVQTVDSNTKEPITIIFQGPTMGQDRQWPKAFSMSSPTSDVSKMTIRWIDIGDVDVVVSADGHEGVPLTLNAATPRELVVPLRRAGHAKQFNAGVDPAPSAIISPPSLK